MPILMPNFSRLIGGSVSKIDENFIQGKICQGSRGHAMESPPKRIVKIAKAWSREDGAASC